MILKTILVKQKIWPVNTLDKVSELQLVLESSRTPHPEFPLIKLNPYKKKTKK